MALGRFMRRRQGYRVSFHCQECLSLKWLRDVANDWPGALKPVTQQGMRNALAVR